MTWWPGISQDVFGYVSKCKECQENRPSLGKTVFTWPEAEVWERLRMHWRYVKDQGNIWVIVDAGSSWIEALPAENRTWQTVKVHLSQIFTRLGIPRTLVSDNGPEFVSSDQKQWCESIGIKKMESPIYHPRGNEIAERAVQTMKRAIQACSPNLNVSFWRFPTAGFDDTLEHFQELGQNSCRTATGTQSKTSSSHWFWSVWTSPHQTEEQFTNGSSYFHYP